MLCDKVVCVKLIVFNTQELYTSLELDLKTALIYVFFISGCKLLTTTVHI